MSREYTAFISYRHCPLDISVAEALHKLIEHYRIPKDLRKDGQKHLGLVFRDRDELPLSSNLTNDIYEALDHSRYLIVVCTPDTPKSRWVEQEIQYFIEKHGRERVLTVLASGTPEESIPKAITHIYSPDGKSEETQIEPLYAFLVDKDARKILKNLKKEFLRLAAALIGCHYDALVQRQKRYRAQQISYAVGSLALIAMLFVGMLVNRNLEISQKNQEIEQRKLEIEEQLLQTQINESKALTLLSQQQLADGDHIKALESALNALPHDDDGRPYYAPAEYALSEALNIYSPAPLDFYATISQPTEIAQLVCSDDGQYLITLDIMGTLRCFDTLSTAMLWESSALADGWTSSLVYDDSTFHEYANDHTQLFHVIDELELIIYANKKNTYTLSLNTGKMVNRVSFCSERLSSTLDIFNGVNLSPDGRRFVQYSKPYAIDIGVDTEDFRAKIHYVEVYDTETFALLFSASFGWGESWYATTPTFSPDGSKLTLAFYDRNIEIVIVDIATHEITYLPNIESAEGACVGSPYLVWLPNNELLFSYKQENFKSGVASSENTYLVKFHANQISATAGPFPDSLIRGSNAVPQHFLTDTHIYFISEVYGITGFSLNSLERTATFGAPFEGVYLRDDGSVMVAMENGTIYYGTCSTEKESKSEIYQMNKSIAAAAGVDGLQEIFCLVPEDARHTVLVLSKPFFQERVSMESPAFSEYGSSHTINQLSWIVSPSGKEVFAMDEDLGENETYSAITVYDAQTLEITNFHILNNLDYIMFFPKHFMGFSSDETKMFFYDYVYDRLTHTQTELSNNHIRDGWGVDYPPYYTQPEGSPILSATRVYKEIYCWEDGCAKNPVSIPYDMEIYFDNSPYNSIPVIGHNGLYVLPLFENKTANRTSAFGILSIENEEWHLIENPVNSSGFPLFAIGAQKKEIAFADYDRILRIYDHEHNAVTRQWALPIGISPSSIVEMQYISDDQYLMIMTNSHEMHLMDMQDGTILGCYEYTADTVPYIDGTSLYLINYPNSFRIDLKTGEVLGRFQDLCCILPGNDQKTVIFSTLDHQLSAYPLYTWEELAQMGWDRLNTLNANRLE